MSPLDRYVTAFVDEVGGALSDLSGSPAGPEVALEAHSIVRAIVSADGRLTDSELDAWLDAIGPRLDPPVLIGRHQLRETDLLTGDPDWLGRPSELFSLLVAADTRSTAAGSQGRARLYYDAALKLAHATAAIDLVPSPDEIAAIDRFRTTLLGALDAAGVPRPGQPSVARSAEGAPAVAPNAAVALPPRRPIDEVLAELDALIGLDSVKTEVRRMTSLLRVQRLRAEHDLPTVETSRHLVFTGNPGTGKTTVARLLSQIYRSLDVVTKGHLVEADRSDLVAGYVGQTAGKTRAILESALGGTLLIDEAYALVRGGENDFGREAIDTLVKFMEDHRDDLAIVACGYPAEMAELIDANPGLASRFTRTIVFADYTTDELVAIFASMSAQQRYHLDEPATARLRALIDAEPRGRGFGNARMVRNVFEAAIARQAMRLATVETPTVDQLTELLADDLADESPGQASSAD